MEFVYKYGVQKKKKKWRVTVIPNNAYMPVNNELNTHTFHDVTYRGDKWKRGRFDFSALQSSYDLKSWTNAVRKITMKTVERAIWRLNVLENLKGLCRSGNWKEKEPWRIFLYYEVFSEINREILNRKFY